MGVVLPFDREAPIAAAVPAMRAWLAAQDVARYRMPRALAAARWSDVPEACVLRAVEWHYPFPEEGGGVAQFLADLAEGTTAERAW